MIVIDGSLGEGGGQIVRSSLALSAATGTPVTIENVRAGRRKPGLLRQHRVAVEALARIACAQVEGAELGSTRVSFSPGGLVAGEHHFAIGSAGSTMLVLQAVLPALLLAPGPSTLVLEGGTHNPFAPPYDFAARVLAPHLATCGAEIDLALERHGFFPAGGGRVSVRVQPATAPAPLVLEERAPAAPYRGRVLVSKLADKIARRERDTLAGNLGVPRSAIQIERIQDSVGPGNVVLVEVPAVPPEKATTEDALGEGAEGATVSLLELATAFGERGVTAERVAVQAADAAKRFVSSTAPVGVHLADQLLVPLALLAGGRFRTLEPSLHTRTNADVVNAFLPGAVTLTERGRNDWTVEVGGRRG